jgi:hypothetical protein
MEKEIASIPLGPEIAVDLKLIDGKVVIAIAQNGADGFVKLEAGLGPKPFLEKLKVMIPGQIDDMVITALEAALGVA